MADARIICVGNRHVDGDDTGPRVFDRLKAGPLPGRVDLVDGGLAGLDLLRWFEHVERVVVVDAVAGFAPPGEIVVLGAPEVAACCDDGRWGHEAGLPYLLAVLPKVCDGPLPEVLVVGAQAPVGDCGIEALARRCLTLVTATKGAG